MRDANPSPGITPEDCLRRFRGGAPGALGELFDLTAPELFAVALSLAPDAASAEDALQETFLALLGAADRHDPARPVLPWLMGILRMKVKEARRRARRAPDPRRLRPLPAPDDPVVRAAESEITVKAREALDRLPEPYRSVALLRWRYGLEPSEIAHVRSEPPGTVRSILHRALAQLRKRLPALPAFLLLPRPARGLDEVRRAILAKAGVAAAVSSTGGALGGLVMGKKLLALAAALLALLLLGAWLVSRREPSPAAPDAEEARLAQAEGGAAAAD
ncbi:MAG: RNA polymerase sigma factor, partial [Planctomycetota bacterium]